MRSIFKMKIFRLPVGLCFLMFTAGMASAQKAENTLDASQKAYILSRFCTEVKYNFAFYDKVSSVWDSLCMAHLPMLTATQSDAEFLNGMKSLCCHLRDGHTFIFSSNNPTNSDDWIRPFPMETKRVGDHVFVTEVYNSEFQKRGLCRDCEVLKIDGEAVISYGEKHLQPYLASSTPQWTKYAPFGNFELTQAEGSRVTEIEFRTPEGKRFIIKSNRLIAWDMKKQSSALTYRLMDNGIGYLKISSFQQGSFSREKFDELYPEILRNRALIIDVRDNGGGNSLFADYVISHFSNRPIPVGQWNTPMYIAAHGSWGYDPEAYAVKPRPIMPVDGKEIYTKPVVLLVNAGTFSSAENFCVAFRGARRGKIIGTPTGGSTGNPISVDLSFGIGCCICTKHELDADGNEFVGIGIRPDIEVAENEDLFLKNNDNVVDAALKELEKQL